MGPRTRGTVVEYDPDLGFGFIKPDNDMRRHVVVRAGALQKAGLAALAKGDRIEFTLIYTERYIPIAEDIVRLTS